MLGTSAVDKAKQLCLTYSGSSKYTAGGCHLFINAAMMQRLRLGVVDSGGQRSGGRKVGE